MAATQAQSHPITMSTELQQGSVAASAESQSPHEAEQSSLKRDTTEATPTPQDNSTSVTLPPPPAFTPSPSPPPQSSDAAAETQSGRSPPSLHSSQRATPSHAFDSPSAETDRTDSHISEASSSSHTQRLTSFSDKRSASSLRKPAMAPQLIDHLPIAKDAAMATFTEISTNDYHDKKLGRPPGKFDDYMLCDCNPNTENLDLACTDESGCINRMTQIECSASKCRWAKSCRNQRFQRRQYASVDIVQTEKKGFGLRAAQLIRKDAFVYEYVGEVMNQPTFLERMQQYRVEGIRHFYFMMLQPNEYLDATKKGGKARFINHSCNPNCFVSKWQVGKQLRMGIFAKRDIAKGEELTFNYNVDRYGNDAQVCYCGEPNCVGTLGGKTQTDLSGMDDLFLDALGIAEEVEQTEAKGSRRKRGKRLDLDFIPKMRPIQQHEATKVMTAARQAGPKREILEKLLRRMEMTNDIDVQKALVKLHGFILMQFLLEQWWNDREIVLLIINTLARWPLIARNKVIDCGVEDQVRDIANTYRPASLKNGDEDTKVKLESLENAVKDEAQVQSEGSGAYAEMKEEQKDSKLDHTASQAAPAAVPGALAPPKPDAEVSQRAQHLLDAWQKLDMTYRIARREAADSAADGAAEDTAMPTWVDRRRMEDLDDPLALDEAQAPNVVSAELGKALSDDQQNRESAWKPPPPPPSTTVHSSLRQRAPRPMNGLAPPRPSPGTFTPNRTNGAGHSPRTPDQATSALSSSLAKSLPGLVSSLQQQTSAPAKSIEDIIREANEQEEKARKEAEAAAKAARERELAGGASGSSARKRPSSSSRSSDKRYKASSSTSSSLPRSSSTVDVDLDTDAGTADGAPVRAVGNDLLATNEKKLRKMVGEIVVRQMSKHKDQFEKEAFKRYAKDLTNVIVGKEMKNPKSWPPPRGTVLADFPNDKRTKIKAFSQEYIGKLLFRKGKSNGAASGTPYGKAAPGSVDATPASTS